MITPTAAPCAARNPMSPPQGTYFPLTLVPSPPAAQAVLAGPRRFIVQISPLIYRSLPLPPGLDQADAERYVRAYAQIHGQDCCLESAGSRTIYLLSNGTRFEAGR